MSRKRALLYASLALAVPLPAIAFEHGSGPASLEVRASLDGCGVTRDSIVCAIDASFNRLEQAEYYTAGVTAPDGSVTELGTVAEGGGSDDASSSLWVPYAGNGTYAVTITAWGYDERVRPDVVRSEGSVTKRDARPPDHGGLEAIEAPEDAAPEDPAAPEQGSEEPAPGDRPRECPEPPAPAPTLTDPDQVEPAPVPPTVEAAPPPCEQPARPPEPPPTPAPPPSPGGEPVPSPPPPAP
jgi:hypothetical protein